MKCFKFVDVNSPKTFHGITKFLNVYGNMKYKFCHDKYTKKPVTYILFMAMISKKPYRQ